MVAKVHDQLMKFLYFLTLIFDKKVNMQLGVLFCFLNAQSYVNVSNAKYLLLKAKLHIAGC